MKKYLFLMLALVIVSCSDQMLLDEAQGESSNMTPVSEFQTLLEKPGGVTDRLISSWQIATGTVRV